MARPQVEIDSEVVEGMAGVGATNCEIADFCGVDEGTIRHRFSEILTKARSSMKKRLRQVQYRQAVDEGNTTMLIWLGKQMLGQSDKSELSGPDKGPIEFNETIDLASASPEELDYLRTLRDNLAKRGQMTASEKGNHNGSSNGNGNPN